MATVDELRKRFEALYRKALESMSEIKTWNKVYQFVLEDDGKFYVEISGGSLKIVDGTHPNPIATLTTTTAVLDKILKGELDSMKAFMTRQLKITGNVFDTMNLKKLIDAGLGKA